MNPVLNHPKLQVSVQQFFKGVSWSGQVAPADESDRQVAAAMIQTFHPIAEELGTNGLSLMRSVRGFMNNIPWAGAIANPINSPAAAGPVSPPTNLDAFSDFF